MVLSTRTLVFSDGLCLLDPSLTQVDAFAAHGDSLREQELALPPAFRQAAIGADDAMPWQVIVGGR